MKMQKANVHIIREAVILLLRRNGYSVIEATDKWDRVYSVQYQQATPNVTHVWHIGGQALEFIKIDTSERAEPVQEQASSGLLAWVVAFALLTIATIGVIVIF
jgi:hypothetical protein